MHRALVVLFLNLILTAANLHALDGPPTVTLPDGWKHGLRGQSYSVPMVVTNNAAATRTLCFSSRRAAGPGGTPDSVTTGNPTVPGCQSFTAGQTKTLQAGYTMANGDWDGDAVQAYVTAYDQQNPSLTSEAWFKISVLMASNGPAPETLQTGRSYTRRFRFFNQDRFGTAHTYAISNTTSGGAVFHNILRPATVTIPAGTWGDVDVSFTVPQTAAGQTGALTITLKDTDPNWPDRIGTTLASVTAVDVLAPSVTLPDGWVHGLRNQSYVARMEVKNNSSAARTLCFSSRRSPGSGGTVNSVTTSDPTVPPCQSFGGGETRSLQFGYTMANSDWDGDGIQAYLTAYDQGDPARAAEAWTKISVLMSTEAPAPAALQTGRTYTYTYRFFNQDRFGTPHTYSVTHNATPGLFQNVTRPSTVTIPAGAWGTVDVSFTLPAGSAGRTGALEVQLKDTDPNWPDRIGRALASVTAIDVLAPAVELPDGWRHGLRGQSYSVRLAVTNNTAAPRTLCFSSRRSPGSGGNVNNVTTADPSVPPCQLFGANETRMLQAGYTMADSDWDGDGIQAFVAAYDQQEPSRATESWFKVSVLMASTAPAPATLQAGQSYTYTYRFFNRDRFGTPHTYSVSAVVTGDAVFQNLGVPSSIALAAGAWGDVNVTFTVPSGSAGQAGSLTVSLKDTDPNWPDRIGSATAAVTSGTVSVANPTVTAPGNQTDPPGSQRTATFQVKNNSSASRTFTFAASSSNANVVPDPLDPAPQTIGAGATAGVSVPYTVFGSAGQGSSATIALSATDSADTTRSGSAAFAVTVANAPAPSAKFTGYSIYPSNLDHPTGIPIQLGAGLLDARQYRQWIGWQGCAPNYFPNGDPDIAYTPNVPQFAAANRGKLYIFLDEPAHGTVWNHRAGTATGCRQVTPEQYARAYHAFVQSVRAADPTARFSPAGFEQFRATPDSYGTAFIEYAGEFYDQYVQIYGTAPPVDEWRFHVYWEWWPDPSEITQWRAKANAAIGFAQSHGAPVVLGIGYPWQSYDARMLDGMSNMFAYLKDHSAVASVFWFSYDEWHDGENRLTTHQEGGSVTRTLTTLGQRYLALIQGLGNPSTGSPVAVTPDSMNAYVAGGAPGTQQFAVKNLGSATATYVLGQSCSGSVTNCGAPNPAQVTLAPSQSQEVSVSYSMAASGSGSLTLDAVQSGVPGVNDSGSYQLTTTVSNAFGFDLSVHNGDHVNVAQFGANLTYTTPAYVSRDVPRAVTLFYSSAQASPRGMVQVEVNDPVPPQRYSILLYYHGSPVTFTNGSLENFFDGGSGGLSRLAVQADASALPTGAHDVAVVVRRWNNGQVTETSTQVARVLIINEANSPYGAGWSIDGLQRIHVQGDGSLVLTPGNGTALYYRKPAGCGSPCTYTRPPGEWSEITSDGTQFVRAYRDGSRAVFSANGLLARLEDRFGTRTSYLYDDTRLRLILDPAATATDMMSINLTYAGGKLSTITDVAGRSVAVNIDANGDLRGITDPDSVAALRPDYTGHLLTGWLDRLGNRWDVTYDHAGMLASTLAPTVSVDVPSQNARPETKVQSLAAALLPAAAKGPTSITNPAARVSSPPRLTTTDARNVTTSVTVDRFGAPTQLWDAHGMTTILQRNAHSQVERVIAPSGGAIAYAWQPSSPLLAQVHDETTGRIVNYEYTTHDQPLRVSGDVPETLYKYDGTARLISVETRRADGTWAKQSVELAADGRLLTVGDPAGHQTTYDYSGNRFLNLRFINEGAGGSRVTSFVHDAFGRVSKTTAPSDANTPLSTTTIEYDALNRVKAVLDALQNRTSYSYAEGEGKLTTSIVDARANAYHSVQNALGWVESDTDPRGNARTHRYDRNGNPLEVTNRRGGRLSMTYDEANRLRTRIDHTTGAQTTWEYDNTHGLWLKATNGESSNRVTFDTAGRQVEEQITLGGTMYTLASGYNHPAYGMRTDLQWSAPWLTARTIHYAFDAQGLLESIRDVSGATTVVGRDADGMVRSTRLPGNVGVEYGPTSHHVASGISFYNLNGPVAPDLGAGYTLDAWGRIRSRWNVERTEARTHVYDPMGRVKEVWRQTQPPPNSDCVDPEVGVCLPTNLGGSSGGVTNHRTHLFDYDATGNRRDNGGQLQAGGGNRLVTFGAYTMAYDDDGNMTSKSGSNLNQTLQWNALGQLTSVVTNNVTSAFGYDAFGRRVRKTTQGVTTRYLHDGVNLLAELDSAGAPLREYTFYPAVDEPLSVRQNGETYYYLIEQPGHVVALVDRHGQAVNRYTYGPWGETSANETGPQNPLRFGAREYDSDSGLYYLRARYYDPSLGRFISEDPIGLAGGINPYVYVENDPVNRTDPMGLQEKCSLLFLWIPDENGVEKPIMVIICSGAGGGGTPPPPPGSTPLPPTPTTPTPPSGGGGTPGETPQTEKPMSQAERTMKDRCNFRSMANNAVKAGFTGGIIGGVTVGAKTAVVGFTVGVWGGPAGLAGAAAGTVGGAALGFAGGFATGVAGAVAIDIGACTFGTWQLL